MINISGGHMIYKILNNITGDFYIGYTSKTLQERLTNHIYAAKGGTNTHLHKAMRKYGCDNFSIECLQEDGNLNEDEALWIAKLQPAYNMTKGGEGGDTSNSPNFKQAMINRRSYAGEGNPNFGKFGQNNPKSQKVIVDGIMYCSITEARKKSRRSFNYVKTNGIFI
jgi:group I intron endonuclease